MQNPMTIEEYEFDFDEISRLIELENMPESKQKTKANNNVVSYNYIAKSVSDLIPVLFTLWAIVFIGKLGYGTFIIAVVAYLYGANIEAIKKFNVFNYRMVVNK